MRELQQVAVAGPPEPASEPMQWSCPATPGGATYAPAPWPAFLRLTAVVQDPKKLEAKKSKQGYPAIKTLHDVGELLVGKALRQLNCPCGSELEKHWGGENTPRNKVTKESIQYTSWVSGTRPGRSSQRAILPFGTTILNVAIARHCWRQGVSADKVAVALNTGKAALLQLAEAHRTISNGNWPSEPCSICLKSKSTPLTGLPVDQSVETFDAGGADSMDYDRGLSGGTAQSEYDDTLSRKRRAPATIQVTPPYTDPWFTQQQQAQQHVHTARGLEQQDKCRRACAEYEDAVTCYAKALEYSQSIGTNTVAKSVSEALMQRANYYNRELVKRHRRHDSGLLEMRHTLSPAGTDAFAPGQEQMTPNADVAYALPLANPDTSSTTLGQEQMTSNADVAYALPLANPDRSSSDFEAASLVALAPSETSAGTTLAVHHPAEMGHLKDGAWFPAVITDCYWGVVHANQQPDEVSTVNVCMLGFVPVSIEGGAAPRDRICVFRKHLDDSVVLYAKSTGSMRPDNDGDGIFIGEALDRHRPSDDRPGPRCLILLTDAAKRDWSKLGIDETSRENAEFLRRMNRDYARLLAKLDIVTTVSTATNDRTGRWEALAGAQAKDCVNRCKVIKKDCQRGCACCLICIMLVLLVIGVVWAVWWHIHNMCSGRGSRPYFFVAGGCQCSQGWTGAQCDIKRARWFPGDTCPDEMPIPISFRWAPKKCLGECNMTQTPRVCCGETVCGDDWVGICYSPHDLPGFPREPGVGMGGCVTKARAETLLPPSCPYSGFASCKNVVGKYDESCLAMPAPAGKKCGPGTLDNCVANITCVDKCQGSVASDPGCKALCKPGSYPCAADDFRCWVDRTTRRQCFAVDFARGLVPKCEASADDIMAVKCEPTEHKVFSGETCPDGATPLMKSWQSKTFDKQQHATGCYKCRTVPGFFNVTPGSNAKNIPGGRSVPSCLYSDDKPVQPLLRGSACYEQPIRGEADVVEKVLCPVGQKS
eukprot:COSAG02_NODE_2246_length_9389_cov_9.281270_2_plen_992_part_00